MRHALTLRIGPATFRIGSAWRGPIDQLARLYAAYPDVTGDIADFTVRLQPTSAARRWLRPPSSSPAIMAWPTPPPCACPTGCWRRKWG